MKIVSFGDSFIYGSELQDNLDGSRAWPGLVANQLGCEYETLANPGCGNENIAMQMYSYFENNSTSKTLAIVNWTWAGRWDFYHAKGEFEKWVTIGPTCVPEKLEKTLNSIKNSAEVVNFGQKYVIKNILWNKFRSLQTMYSALQYMHSKKVNAIHTYMDRMIFDTKMCAPDYIVALQDRVKPYMLDWDGQTFLEWSDSQGFYKTELLHPLEDTHQSACKFWKDIYQDKLKNAKD